MHVSFPKRGTTYFFSCSINRTKRLVTHSYLKVTRTKKSASIVLILISLITLGTICIQPTKSQNQGITINIDGTITPLSAPIHQTGNTYSLTADVSNSLTIEANNIVVNGGNHTIKGLDQYQNGTAINLVSSNVTVKNLVLTNWNIGINATGNNNTITTNELHNNSQSIVIHGYDYLVTFNTISNSSTAVLLNTGDYRQTGDNNLITQNQITHNFLAFDTTKGNGTTIRANNVLNNAFILALFSNTTNTILYDNNFINNSGVLDVPSPFPAIVIAPFTPNVIPIFPAGQWDNGKIGNYWSDYLTTYPQAAELDHTGIGDKPYISNVTLHYSFSVNGYVSGSKSWSINGTAVSAFATDNYPLMAPISIPVIILTPPVSATSISIEEYLILALVSILMAIAVSILLYRRQRKRLKEREHPTSSSSV
jgi:hypothetical protein